MTSIQRTKNDLATIDKREAADKIVVDSRNKNDALTQERRFRADTTMEKHRIQNDEITASRRETKDINDINQGMALAMSFLF